MKVQGKVADYILPNSDGLLRGDLLPSLIRYQRSRPHSNPRSSPPIHPRSRSSDRTTLHGSSPGQVWSNQHVHHSLPHNGWIMLGNLAPGKVVRGVNLVRSRPGHGGGNGVVSSCPSNCSGGRSSGCRICFGDLLVDFGHPCIGGSADSHSPAGSFSNGFEEDGGRSILHQYRVLRWDGHSICPPPLRGQTAFPGKLAGLPHHMRLVSSAWHPLDIDLEEHALAPLGRASLRPFLLPFAS